MRYYAIRNRATRKYVVRTVQVGGKPLSITERNGALMFDSPESARRDMERRGLGPDFEVVEV